MARPKGGYKNKDGEQVVGVTTPINRFKDSGGLLYWACEQGKAIERGEINSLYDKRDEAGNAGTLAHEMVEAFIDEEPMPDTSEYPKEIVDQAKQGFENYANWATNNRIQIIKQEIVLVSEKYQYGGTPDGIGYDAQGRLILVDWKTSNKVYPDFLIQLAAYNQLWNENNPNTPIAGGFHLCRFSKEHADFAHHYYAELDDAWEQFKIFLQAYKIDKKLKKRV